jgi:hypothetical protein
LSFLQKELSATILVGFSIPSPSTALPITYGMSSMVESNGKASKMESKRQAVFALLDENPHFYRRIYTAKTTILFLFLLNGGTLNRAESRLHD